MRFRTLLLCLLATSADAQRGPRPTDALVYAAALDSIFVHGPADGRILLMDSTARDLTMLLSQELLLPRLRIARGLDSTILNAIPRAVTEPWDLRRDSAALRTSRPLTFIASADLPRVERNPTAFWSAFDEKFPNARGFTKVSPIIYSQRGDQALVLVDNACGSLCGSARIVLLARDGERWRVTQMIIMWVS